MSEGAIRYNYQAQVWEFSNDRREYHRFARDGHTHRSAEIIDASPDAIANAVVRRGPLGEAALSRIVVGGTSRIEGLFVRVGTPNPIQDNELQNSPTMAITGPTSNFKIVIQDGSADSGRANLLWNASRAAPGGRYLVANEAAARLMIGTGNNGARFGFFSASRGMANQEIVWHRRLLIEDTGAVHIGHGEDLMVSIETNGNMTLPRGRVYALSYETHSARKLKTDIAWLEESALEILNAVPIYTFKYERDESNQQRVGIIADEVRDSRISGANHDRFDIGSTVGLLIKAVQELSQRVEELERRLQG